MNFIVEDGTGLESATSYISVVDADSYVNTFVVEGRDAWNALTTQEKEAALMRAARFLDGMMAYTSTIKDNKQSLAWPRIQFFDKEGRIVQQDRVPSVIKDAQVEIAVSSLNYSLTTEVDKLIREDFGDTSDQYAAPVSRGGNPIIQTLIKSLAFLGYGHSKATVVTIWRA